MTNFAENQFMQQSLVAIIAQNQQDEDHNSTDVEALSPRLDDDLLARATFRAGLRRRHD